MILTKESFAQKCSVVLEGLRAEAIVKIREVQSKGMNNWSQSEKLQHRPAPGMEEPRQEPNNEAVQVEMEETSFFGVALNDMNFVSLPVLRTAFIHIFFCTSYLFCPFPIPSSLLLWNAFHADTQERINRLLAAESARTRYLTV